MICKCGNVIHPKRVEILKKARRQVITCINCATEEKHVGYMTIDGKTERAIQIVDANTAKNLQYLDKLRKKLN